MISHLFLLRRGTVSDKSSIKNQDTIFYVQSPPFENRAIYDKNFSELEGHRLQYETCALDVVYL